MRKISMIIARFPLVTFFFVLGVLFAVIFVGREIRTKENIDGIAQGKIQDVVLFDQSARMQTSVSGEVDRADTVVLRATANGIVTRALFDGARVYRGQEIVKLSDTYSGVSQADTAVALAQRNVQYQNETVDTQRDILRAQDKEIKRTDDRLAKIARKQNFLQQRSVDFAYDTARLQAVQASVQAAVFRTVAPLAGQLEEILVRVGDTVQAGQMLAVLKADNKDDIRIVAHVGVQRVAHIDLSGKVIAHYDNREIELETVHIARGGAENQSYALTFRAPKEIFADIADGAFVEIDIPLMREGDTLIPLDAVRFSDQNAEVYIYEDGIAHAKSIVLGDVIGSVVLVQEGLTGNEYIIMNRTVTDGETVTQKNEDA